MYSLCLVSMFADAAIVMEMAPKEGKELLGKNTDQAFAEGAFGLPWFVAENSKGERDVVWGVDHLAVVAEHLGIEKPRMRGWNSLL
jgi:2-hydroxychromene-2-carboxylate isomerase